MTMHWLKDVSVETWRDRYGDDKTMLVQIAGPDETPGPHEVAIGWDTGKKIVGLVIDRVRLPMLPSIARGLAKRLIEAADAAEGKK